MNVSSPMLPNVQMQRPRSILELLAEELKVPATNEEEARIRLKQLEESFPARTREVVSYILGSTKAEMFFERRGGGSSLWYILWWMRTHARDHYESGAKASIRLALSGKWLLDKGYENLSLVNELRPYLPPAPGEKKGNYRSGELYILQENNLTIAVNTQCNDLWTTAVREGAQVYVWATDTFVDMKVDGRSGLGFPDLSPEWAVLRRGRQGLPTYCRLPRRASNEEMRQLIDYIRNKSDRRKTIPFC